MLVTIPILCIPTVYPIAYTRSVGTVTKVLRHMSLSTYTSFFTIYHWHTDFTVWWHLRAIFSQADFKACRAFCKVAILLQTWSLLINSSSTWFSQPWDFSLAIEYSLPILYSLVHRERVEVRALPEKETTQKVKLLSPAAQGYDSSTEVVTMPASCTQNGVNILTLGHSDFFSIY